MTNETQASNYNSEAINDVDLESEAAKVEMGDNFVVILDELENDDPFYVVLCNKPLHRCKETFDDDWGNTWYEGDMTSKVLGIIECKANELLQVFHICY